MSDNLWESIQGLFLPMSNQVMQQERVDEALAGQNEAARQAQENITQGYQQVQGMYQPMIDIGDTYLQELQQGIQSGAYLPDESAFAGYKPYQAQAYTPQAQFQSTQQQPGAFNYNQAQPQFQAYQPNQEQPSFNTAPNAQAAQYYDPGSQQQYQSTPFEIGNDPVYQRRIQEANRAAEASGAAQGMQLSGAMLKELQGNASDIAAEEGAAAYNRWNQQDQTGYGRWRDQQADTREAMQYQSEDEYRRYLDSVGIRGAEAEQRVNQYNTNRQFGQTANVQNAQVGTDVWNTGFQNTLAAQGMNLGQYNTNRAFDYGAYQDYGNNQFDAAQYNNANQQLQNAQQYQVATDAYGRAYDRGQQQYGMNAALANLGVVGRENIGQAASDYWGSLSDISIGQANAAAAAAAAKNQNQGLLSILGL